MSSSRDDAMLGVIHTNTTTTTTTTTTSAPAAIAKNHSPDSTHKRPHEESLLDADSDDDDGSNELSSASKKRRHSTGSLLTSSQEQSTNDDEAYRITNKTKKENVQSIALNFHKVIIDVSNFIGVQNIVTYLPAHITHVEIAANVQARYFNKDIILGLPRSITTLTLPSNTRLTAIEATADLPTLETIYLTDPFRTYAGSRTKQQCLPLIPEKITVYDKENNTLLGQGQKETSHEEEAEVAPAPSTKEQAQPQVQVQDQLQALIAAPKPPVEAESQVQVNKIDALAAAAHEEEIDEPAENAKKDERIVAILKELCQLRREASELELRLIKYEVKPNLFLEDNASIESLLQIPLLTTRVFVGEGFPVGKISFIPKHIEVRTKKGGNIKRAEDPILKQLVSEEVSIEKKKKTENESRLKALINELKQLNLQIFNLIDDKYLKTKEGENKLHSMILSLKRLPGSTVLNALLAPEKQLKTLLDIIARQQTSPPQVQPSFARQIQSAPTTLTSLDSASLFSVKSLQRTSSLQHPLKLPAVLPSIPVPQTPLDHRKASTSSLSLFGSPPRPSTGTTATATTTTTTSATQHPNSSLSQ